MNLSDVFKPNRYTYTSPNVPKAAVSKPQEVAVAPSLPSSTQVQGSLLQQGYDNVGLNLFAQRGAINNGVYGKEALARLQSDQAWDKSDIETSAYKENTGTFVDGTLKIGGQRHQQGMQVADRLAELGRGTTDAVGRAIGGEQANDAARLQLMRDVLMKPKGFTETLAELTGAIAPIVSLFV